MTRSNVNMVHSKRTLFFAVADIKLLAPSMQSIVANCGIAAKSADARDKYFQSYVEKAEICSSRSEPLCKVRMQTFIVFSVASRP